MTNLKLQKLVYYAQALHLGTYGTPLFRDKIEAWVHGPAVPDLWRKYKDYGNTPILCENIDYSDLDSQTKEFLGTVWSMYGGYSASYLETLSHKELPWLEAREGYEPGERCSNEITLDSMKDYFSSKKKNAPS